MSGLRISLAERVVTHAVLVAGCIVFSFPFMWMVLTSVKVEREMSAREVRWLPTRPRPTMSTPYIDTRKYEPVSMPDDVPPVVWRQARPLVVERLERIVDEWTPRLKGPADNPSPRILDAESYRAEMVEGLATNLAARISDEARSRAVALERERWTRENGGADTPTPRELEANLSEGSVRAGVDAIVAEVDRLVDDEMLLEVFEESYRRFCLGEVRVRSTDYDNISIYTGDEWSVESGPAKLLSRIDATNLAQEVELRFAKGEREASFVFVPKKMPVPASETDRIYVRFRGDESWARVGIEVEARDVLYKYVAPKPVYLYEREWVEVELRWPGGEGGPVERKPYQVLERGERLGDDAPEFLVRMTVKKNGPVGAWVAKLRRNYRKAFEEVPYARYMMTSFSLVILSVLLAIFSCTMVGYAFARLHWPGRDFCFVALLATMMIPGQVTMIPSFLIMKWLGWFNTLLPLWVPASFGAPFFIFLVRQFFKNVPLDLEDAARVDGCGFLRIYWHVMLPLIKPTIATIAIFTFMGAWNNFMLPLIYVNDERLFPLALGLFKFNLRSGGEVCLMMAGAFMMTTPIIVLFFFAQRYFIQGISLTGTKG